MDAGYGVKIENWHRLEFRHHAQALYTTERAHLTKSNEQMVDLVVQFRGKPRLEIQPVNLAYEYKPSNV